MEKKTVLKTESFAFFDNSRFMTNKYKAPSTVNEYKFWPFENRKICIHEYKAAYYCLQ